MEIEETTDIKDDPLLNNSSDALKNSASEPNVSPTQSLTSKSLRHDFLFKVIFLLLIFMEIIYRHLIKCEY